MRWTTGVGIVLGGTGGALAALLGGPSPAPPPAPRAASASPAIELAATVPAPVRTASVQSQPQPPPASPSGPASGSAAAPAPSSAPAAASADGSGSSPLPPSAPLTAPTTREALLKAELYCDQKKSFDDCERAAQAHETGSAGALDAAQAKRFRRIALTHLVTQCESGTPHACFVLAAKYRTGTELAQNLTAAAALEQRALEICKLRPSDPHCALPAN